MKVCKCDRCGRIFEPYPHERDWYNKVIQLGVETFGLTDIVGEVESSYDVCDDCYNDFQKWFRRGRIRNING